MSVIQFPSRRQIVPPKPPVDALIAELTELEIELRRAQLAQLRSEMRQARAFWAWYWLKRILFLGVVLWLLTTFASGT